MHNGFLLLILKKKIYLPNYQVVLYVILILTLFLFQVYQWTCQDFGNSEVEVRDHLLLFLPSSVLFFFGDEPRLLLRSIYQR